LKNPDVANLWTEFTALHCYGMEADVKECKKPNKTLVAATFEKQILTSIQAHAHPNGGKSDKPESLPLLFLSVADCFFR
jgi:hypothetical protein